MPGRFFLTRPAAEIARLAGYPGPVPETAPRRNVAPGQQVLTLTAAGWSLARWGMIPVGRVNARGRPVMETIVNARSETVFDKSAFAGVTRAVVPADGWYEWTGKTRRKIAWRIARTDAAPLFFAAIHDVWQAPGGGDLPQVATVTCPPSADVAAIYDRMGVILAPSDIALWLSGEPASAALMRPLAAGSLTVEEATGVDWAGP